MIISHSNKFILARPMKTAGLSFETAVSNYCSYGDIITAANRDEDWIRQQLKARRHRNDRTPVSNTRIRPHMPLKRLFRNSKLVPGQTPDKGFASEYTPDINAAMRTYQIVSMTRNPWEKIRSLYYHHLRFMKADERSVSFKNWCNTVNPLVNSGDEDGAGIQTTLDYYLLRDFRVLNKFHSRVDFWIRFHYMKQDIINFERHYKMDDGKRLIVIDSMCGIHTKEVFLLKRGMKIEMPPLPQKKSEQRTNGKSRNLGTSIWTHQDGKIS